jgi:hypothetical protein
LSLATELWAPVIFLALMTEQFHANGIATASGEIGPEAKLIAT